MITTITLNPAIDKSIVFDNVSLGSVNRMKESRSDIGGKGINVSKVLKLLGNDTCASGILGSKNSVLFRDFLAQSNIVNGFIEVYGSTRTNIKMLELAESRTTDLNDKGIEICEESKLVFEKKLVELATKSEYVVLSGSLPPGFDDSYYGYLTSLINTETKVVIDASGKKLLEAIKNSPSIVKPNLEELEEAFNVKLENEVEVKKFCQQLLKDYSIDEIIVTMGKEGSILVTREKAYLSKPIIVKALNTVSAGDSFLGGYLSVLEKSSNKFDALCSAVACGTLAVTKVGTELFTFDEYMDMLCKVDIVEI